MVGPWKRALALQQAYDELAAHTAGRIETLLDEAADSKLKLALAEQALRTAERDLERSLAELHLVQQDFRHLVATATRLPQKTQPMDFTRDPFAEDITIPDQWLSDDSTTIADMPAIEELLDSGQSEDGVSRGPGSGPGAEGPS